jgi:hypothetical protein
MDGNNAVKCVAGAGYTDECMFVSDYVITSSEVDQFKDDIWDHPGSKGSASIKPATEAEGAPLHGSQHTVCTNNWVAANAISKETLQLFEQTGIFVSVCRHGFVQTLVEM